LNNADKRLTGVVEQLLDATTDGSRVAFEYHREILGEIRAARLQLDKIEGKLGIAPHPTTALEHLAAGQVPIAWFVKGAKMAWKFGVVQAAVGGGSLWLAHALHLIR